MAHIPILFQDESLVAVHKPAGVPVHRSSMVREREVVMMVVRDQLGKHVWPVHRLDRGTSGVLLFALTEERARIVHGAFEAGQVHKEYLALVRGQYTGPELLDYPVPKDENGERVPARTRFRLEERFEWSSLVRAWPETGRFHQIRRHLAHLRFPIANDTNYGTGWFNRLVRADLGLVRLGLHAEVLTLEHLGARLSIRAELPDDMALALQRARGSCGAAPDG